MWLGFPVSSSPLLFFPRLPPCWNVGRLGRFMVRISSSLSNKFQLEPEDSSHVGIEATRDGCRRARPVGTAIFLDLRVVGFQSPTGTCKHSVLSLGQVLRRLGCRSSRLSSGKGRPGRPVGRDQSFPTRPCLVQP